MQQQVHSRFSESLLTGDFLAAYTLPGCEEFEEWLSMRRGQLRIRQVNLLQTLTNCARTQGNIEKAITYIQRLIKLDPDDESHLRLAMCLYIEVGRREAALKIYDTFTQRLERELGVQPQAPTVALHETIASSPAALDNPTFSGKKTFPAIQKLSLVVVLRIQWVSLSQDPEETAQSLYDADQLAKSILTDKLKAFPLSGAGKGTLFYFGWPKAQDDAAWCAARGAMRFLSVLKLSFPLISARIGIHAGRLLSGTDEMIPDLIGDISEEVSHLTNCAQPGEIMISHIVQQLLSSRIDSHRIGERRRQIDGSIQSVYKLPEGPGTQALTDITHHFVGREKEIDQLDTALEFSRHSGRGRTIAIEGAPGVGKTALTNHWINLNRVDIGKSANLLKILCTPDACMDTLYATICSLRQHIGLNTESPQINQSELQTCLQTCSYNQTGDSRHLLKALSRFSTPEAALMEQLYLEMSELLKQTLAPTGSVLWLEDAHWSDKGTLGFIKYLETHANFPLLIVVTQRTRLFSSLDKINLDPLDREQSKKLLSKLPLHMKEHYADKSITDAATLSHGNPFFMLELTKNAVFRDKLPDTIIAHFSKLIDDLGDYREQAMFIAAACSEISFKELELVTEKPARQLQHSLEQLISKGILVRQDKTRYSFTHPLLHLALVELTTNSRQRHFRQIISTKLTKIRRETLFLTEN
ncbi:BTAD domain-containing putative transcriptional regulator [Nitrincola sp. MINF-07-Sa-05]|uniref:BTAD domain-containing putative transcriptional regulator n=1 Tax=Nitrincola salilacus TaxID=3400273 RepID=UPI00391829B9